jgi:hypothetical protein
MAFKKNHDLLRVGLVFIYDISLILLLQHWQNYNPSPHQGDHNDITSTCQGEDKLNTIEIDILANV